VHTVVFGIGERIGKIENKNKTQQSVDNPKHQKEKLFWT
jgi:hypothetical protein